jgi:7,8-dihydropterin-6-yl-methyl-4-(beta-D-ribofuranosyl)aminobenzene 5'-phosphate synthase
MAASKGIAYHPSRGFFYFYPSFGGFHLTGARPEPIQKTIADIKAMRPDYVVSTHCTGFEAITAFAREMPDQLILNMAGTKYAITP